MSDDVIDELLFGSPQGGRQKLAPPTFSLVRELGVGDIEPLHSANVADPEEKTITRIRASHHELAKALADGLSQVEAGFLTGYEPSYISRLTVDPAFAELVDFYEKQGEQVRADVMARMRILGLSATDELLRRLEDDPMGFTKRELQEIAKLCLVDSGHTKGGAGRSEGSTPSGAPAHIQISFVESPRSTPREVSGVEIEGFALEKAE